MRFSFCLLLVLAAGCKPSAFTDLGDSTPVRVVESPGSFPRATFGTVLTTYRGVSGGIPFSRIVVSSGDYLNEDTTHASVWATLGGWRDASLSLGETINIRCNSEADLCADGEGASLAALPTFGTETACVLAGAPFANEARVTCESSNTVYPFTSSAPEDLFGSSVAAIPAPSPVGIAVIGAPGGNHVALVRDAEDQTPAPIDFGGVYMSAPGSRFGEALAVAALPEGFRDTLEGELLVAVGAPGARRVVLVLVANNAMAGGILHTEVLGCVDRPESPEFGSVIAAGDLTSDGMPEVLIGARLAVADRVDEILVLSADQVTARQGCQMPGVEDDVPALAAQRITCDADGLLQQFECTGSGLGSAFALGDMDGSGSKELMIGLPLTSVDQVAHAGAALIFPPVTSLDGLVSHGELLPLVDSSPRINDSLGFALAFLPTQLAEGMTPRHEPVVAAPGANRVYVFLCSGLPGDTLAEGTPRCLVEQ
jgi:hypothetical protein